MVLSSMSFAFAAKFEDTADTDYAEAIDTLAALGVITGYEDGTYRPDNTVTRAEMAKLMVELLGYGDLVTGSKSNFTDTQGHWADQWIALAAGRGIVIGTGDGKFNPDGIVTYDQVLTMLVRGLGYTDSSNELKSMPWPTNFKVKAAELNITKNVDMSTTGADRGGVAQAMFNALEKQLVKINTDGDVVGEYVNVGANTKQPLLLVSRIANPNYDFVVGFEHITPADKNYAGDKVDLTSYLFQSVEAYFNKNNEKEVVYVGKVNSLVYTGDFESQDIANDELEVGDYEFDVDGSLVSYNNIEESIGKLNDDNLDNAKITVVLDKDETRIKSGALVAGIIVEKANTYVQIEEEYKADAVEIDEIYLPVKNKKVDEKNLIVKGDATELSDIEVDDIVAVYAPLGEDATVEATDKLTLAVSRKTVEGKVTGTAKDAYYVDKTKYSINNALNLGDLEVGDSGTFYLDDKGDIIAFKGESEGSKTYAIVEEMISGRYEVNGTGTNAKATIVRAPKVKLNTASNETITYSFDLELEWKAAVGTTPAQWTIKDAELAKLFVLGTATDQSTTGDRTITIKTSGTPAKDALTGKLVSYSIDSKSNEIKSIATTGRDIKMKTDSKSFVLASNAVIFNADGDVISESKLGSSVEGTAAYKNGKIVALYDTSAVDEGTYAYAYINSVYKDTDDDENQVQRVNAFVNGKKQDVFTTKKDTVTMPNKGLYIVDFNDNDVIQDDEITLGALSNGTSKEYKYTDKSSATTASAVNASEGTITIGTDEFNFNTGSGTIIRINKDNSIDVISKLSAIKADDTELLYFFDVTNDNGTVKYSTTDIGFIIIFEK